MTQAVPDVADIAQSINTMIAERRVALDVREEAPLPAPVLQEPREEGIYFGMPSATYHADPSLGSTDIKRLLRSPTDYWWQSHMNPDRIDRSDSAAKLKGRALHCLVLEGEKVFEKTFAEEPSAANYPGALVTADDLKRRCRELGEGVSGVKAELSQRIRLKSPQSLIFDDVMATFKAMVERDGLEVLKADAMADVRQSAEAITLNPHLARAFTGGVPEVSVFYRDEHGIPCKARYDYFKKRTILDMKRCTNTRERPFEHACIAAVSEYRYDVSARFYLDGYMAFYRLAFEGKVFGDCPLKPGWDESIAHPEDMLFTWVFHSGDGNAPVTRGFELKPDTTALNRATREISSAKQQYLDCLEHFGTNMWVDETEIKTLVDTDLPAWMRETVTEDL